MIDEKRIEQAIEHVSENTEQATRDFVDTFPEMISYLFDGKFDLLSSEENELMMFLFLAISHSLNDTDLEHFSMEAFQKNEEKNWDLFENQKDLSWEDKLNKAFDKYPQEDLLALVEDLLTEEEDPVLSKIGKEFIFVTTKSFIDCFGS